MSALPRDGAAGSFECQAPPVEGLLSDHILRGTNPAELPLQAPTKYQTVFWHFCDVP
jgi:hypothetical protein